MLTLNTETRDASANLDRLREKGLMPAVFYGKKEKSTPIAVSRVEFLKVWEKAGESGVISLKRDSGEELEALVYDVDIDPITDAPRHADFYVFEKGHKLEIKVPIEFIGVSPAVKDLGGILVKVLHDLNVEAEPKNLPHEIQVDISPLVNFESQILAKDIKLPAGVTLIQNPEEVIASVAQAKEEVEEAPAPDLSSIEVEKKGKKEEEGDEGEGAPQAGSDKGGEKGNK